MKLLTVRAMLPALCAILLLGCATPPHPTRSPTSTTAAQRLIENYLKATNERDLLVLTAYVTPDFEWISMVGGERILEVQSRESLAATLREYFAQYPTATIKIDKLQVVDDFVVVSEHNEWQTDEGRGERTSLGVYELFDGRIRRVTYFLHRR